MILTGTIVNSAAIVAGSIAGLLLGKFNLQLHYPEFYGSLFTGEP